MPQPTPSYLRTEAQRHHPEPPFGAKPPLKLSGIGMLLGTSQPVYTCSAPWCALLLPSLLTPHPVSTCLPRKRESRCKYPMIRVSGQQESSSVGVLSGNSLGRFCTPPANPRSSKLWGRLLSIYTLTLWFQAKVLPPVAQRALRERLQPGRPSLSVTPTPTHAIDHLPSPKGFSQLLLHIHVFTVCFLASQGLGPCIGRVDYICDLISILFVF